MLRNSHRRIFFLNFFCYEVFAKQKKPELADKYYWEEEGDGVRSGPEAARTILLSHIISARPSKQPLLVITSLKVCGLLIFVSAKNKQKTSSFSLSERTAL